MSRDPGLEECSGTNIFMSGPIVLMLWLGCKGVVLELVLLAVNNFNGFELKGFSGCGISPVLGTID